MTPELAPAMLLTAYAQGIFPMADEDEEIHWYSPDPRTIIDLERFHTPRTLRQLYRQQRFQLTVNRDFEAVIDRCADRPEGTWISADMREAYVELHRLGFAHSVEAWWEGRLAGGLYGVALGGAFLGESMFHDVSNASKIALVHLVEQMKQRDFILLDTQFTTEHLRQFNCLEIPRSEYLERLDEALRMNCRLVD